jgi:EAL domain-containing protein (putative c-di-GMP-specific phosphodiesterase class I)
VEFIPVAEQMGLIGPMTYSILRMAARQQHEWSGSGRRLPIAVNLSVRNLYDPMLVKFVDRLFKSWHLSPDLIEFEITESALVDDPESARKALTELRAMGAKIYIDDFGTGYSSLSYLATLPVNSLKVDRSFIRQMAISTPAYSVVSSIISMAHNLNMGVVAEGVETAADLEALRSLGCDEAQGYLFGKPGPAADL